MASLNEIKGRFTSLSFIEIVGKSIEATKSEVVEYQKGQMLHGLNSENTLIGKYKNKDYARRKFNMQPLAGYGNVDLRYTKEFHRNITVRFFSESFVIFSTDWKMEKLTDQYGERIWGLNTPYIAEYSAFYLAAEINKNVKQHLHGMSRL